MRPLLASLILAGCADPSPPLQQHTRHIAPDTPERLSGALDLYVASRAESLRLATDPNEVYELLIGGAFVEDTAGAGAWQLLFTIGDEAFEAELPRVVGLGQGAAPPPGEPFRPQIVHVGDRGGLDASSCRACHFNGGPDGGGTATQAAFFRGDGATLSSATRRDAPHVMGLGYLQRVAREMEAELRVWRDLAVQSAAAVGAPQTQRLRAQGIDFGEITALPDGTLDTSGVRGISPDLVIRPLGHKGRHPDLVALADEALQLHFGVQSDARVVRYGDDPERWLGDGGEFDRDGDGVQREASSGQAVLLGAYLSMLPVPQIRAPQDPALQFAWARGRRVFDAVGCAACHVPTLRMVSPDLTLQTYAGDVAITVPLDEAGQEPRARRLDDGADPDGFVVPGVPIFAFTDLRRHDMGPELAEPVPEVLPDGAGEVPGSVWLTRSLWGLADTPPYLHDGRALTVQAAIEWHGGEAAESRGAWRALPDEDRRALHVFLLSLTRDPTLLVE